jgi:hypothetical protein
MASINNYQNWDEKEFPTDSNKSFIILKFFPDFFNAVVLNRIINRRIKIRSIKIKKRDNSKQKIQKENEFKLKNNQIYLRFKSNQYWQPNFVREPN